MCAGPAAAGDDATSDNGSASTAAPVALDAAMGAPNSGAAPVAPAPRQSDSEGEGAAVAPSELEGDGEGLA